MKILKYLGAGLVGVGWQACLSLPPDRSVSMGPARPNVTVEDVPVRGVDLQVELKNGGVIRGELLAVHATKIYIQQKHRDPEFIRRSAIQQISAQDGAGLEGRFHDIDRLRAYARYPQGFPGVAD